jgi:translation initiation factor 5B
VKAITGLGTTIDVILTNGRLAESQTIVLGGIHGPIITQIRALLMPQPLKELRVKNQYEEFKEIEAAQGVKITGKELDKALAGSPLFVAYEEDEIEVLKVYAIFTLLYFTLKVAL